jgi:hypothetical protein
LQLRGTALFLYRTVSTADNGNDRNSDDGICNIRVGLGLISVWKTTGLR